MSSRALFGAAAFSLVASLSVGTAANANYAYPDAFVCQRDGAGIFTTYAVKGEMEVPIIQWTSNFGASAGYSQQARCEIVSNNFQRSVEDQSLQYLTHGWMNGQPVICTASTRGGSCDNLILTLPHSRAHLAASTLRSLGDAGRLASGPIRQSSMPGSCASGVDSNATTNDGAFGPRINIGTDEPEVGTARDAGCVTESDDGTVYVDMLGVFGHAFN